MAAFNKKGVVTAFSNLFQNARFFFGAFPDESKITADQQRIVRAELFDKRMAKTVKVAVQVAGYINQGGGLLCVFLL